MPGEAKWAQILGSKYSILANRGFGENEERSYLDQPGFHVRAGGGREGWDHSNAHTNSCSKYTMNQCK